MRLFGKVDNTVDRFDRAQWLTPPFDLAFSAVTRTAGGIAIKIAVAAAQYASPCALLAVGLRRVLS